LRFRCTEIGRHLQSPDTFPDSKYTKNAFAAGRGYQFSPNPLAGFEGLLRSGGKEEKRRKKRDEKDGRKHPGNKFLVMA